MKKEEIKKLEKELKYLLKEERKKEIDKYSQANENMHAKEIAKEIYRNRGIDYKKLNSNIFNNITDTLTTFGSLFKNKDSKIRNKMIFDLLYIVVILVLIKLPFDLVRDIGYNYLDILLDNSAIDLLWRLGFLILYTITLLCCLIFFIKNFNNKYK